MKFAGILKHIAAQSGAVAIGFSKAEPVEEREWSLFCKWLEEKQNAGMDYMHNYPDIRRDPRLLLDRAKTIVSLAFSFAGNEAKQLTGLASYAVYEDYHKTIRKKLSPLLKKYFPATGDTGWRICIDSAPILERYWAKKSGIGFQADNGMITIPGVGSRLFLAEIILNAAIPEDEATPWFATGIGTLPEDCGHCGRCRDACPGNALDKTIDCNRCISYLTIEHQGDWDPTGRSVMQTPAGRKTIFGCDRCLSVCRWNKVEQEPSSALTVDKNVENMSKEELYSLPQTEFITKFAKSPIRRTGWEGWRRNLDNTR